MEGESKCKNQNVECKINEVIPACRDSAIVIFDLLACHCEVCFAGRGNLNCWVLDCFASLAMTPIISDVTEQ